VKLKITDAAGREIRDISGTALANSNKAGLQAACWDLRVQPAPAPPPPPGGRGSTPPADAEQARPAQPPNQAEQPGPAGAGAGAGCGAPAPQGGGGFGGGGPNVAGPFVMAGVYNIALIVDGKTVDTKPLRVNDDPEVVLTSAERKRMFDMAMEIHGMQARITEAATAHGALTRQMTELGATIGARSDIPADVKESFDAFRKELAALAPKLALPQGGRGGGRGGATESLITKVGQAKNGLTAGMSPADPTVRAYTEVKAQTPKAIADLNAAIAKATTLSGALAKYTLTLTVPAPIKIIDAAAVKKTSGIQR